MSAADGTLIILASGEHAAVERCRPLFEAMRTVHFYCGPDSGAERTPVQQGRLTHGWRDLQPTELSGSTPRQSGYNVAGHGFNAYYRCAPANSDRAAARR
jgi:hypothetical protein